MPPKKKQEQIDLSTLPECISSNSMLMCLGKKEPAQKILNKIEQQASFISKISKQQVLDHAKQKNIYIDPSTLNDKQKKDPKFMESVCTELTPDVIAKATASLIETLNIKVRMEMKADSEKTEQQKAAKAASLASALSANIEKKFDQLYLFEDFPDNTQDFQALAAQNENIKYILCLNPTISWANAPQLPYQDEGHRGQEGQQQQQQQEEVDEQIKEFRELQKKEQKVEEDIKYEQSILKRIENIKKNRTSANAQSKFRDCIVEMIPIEIDPYNEENSINEGVKTYFNRLGKLSLEYDDFLEWKKDKVQYPIEKKSAQSENENEDKKQENENQQGNQNAEEQKQGEQPEKQNEQVKGSDNEKPLQVKANGSTTVEILTNFVNGIFSSNGSIEPLDQTEQLIENFNFDSSNTDELSALQDQTAKRRQKNSQFCHENENTSLSEQKKQLQQQSRSQLQYPGVNRYLMPQKSTKSEGLRKLGQSQYAQFLKSDLSYEQFQRQQTLTKFQQLLKQSDQDRSYRLEDRQYCQHHDEKSLMRQLYHAMSLSQAHFLTKYNEENDKLYIGLLYKNNPRRFHTKTWEANWKVLPNYESWLKYFKENDSNFNTQQFYDIDYEKIGHINEKVYGFSLPDGGVVIRKQAEIANETNTLLYGIKNHHLFGVNEDTFYSENGQTKVFHYGVEKNKANTNNEGTENKQSEEQPPEGEQTVNEGNNNQQPQQQNTQTTISHYQTNILINPQTRLRLLPTGDIIVEKPFSNLSHTYTPNGYTIVNTNSSNNNNASAPSLYSIFHPTGGITTEQGYTNERGYGMKNGQIHNIPTLQRKTDSGEKIIKRDDNTVIVEYDQKKWIKFHDGTQYLINRNDGKIQIQKQGFPFVTCDSQSGRRIQAEINGIIIEGLPTSQISNRGEINHYQFNIKYPDCNQIHINGHIVEVLETKPQSTDHSASDITSPIIYQIDVKQQSINVNIASSQNEKIQAHFNPSPDRPLLSYHKNNKQLNPLDSQQNYDEESQTLPIDQIPPKLFVINPQNNTGIEYLNQKQLEYYFQTKEANDNNLQKDAIINQNGSSSLHMIKRIPNDDEAKEINNSQTIHIVSRLVPEEELNPKRIKPNFNIDLDVFKYGKHHHSNKEHNSLHHQNILDRYTVRSLIKHKRLLPQDYEQIDSINQKRQTWLKQSLKDQNEFGVKPKGDPLIEKVQNEKNIMIDFRRKEPTFLDFEMLTEEAVNEWKHKQKEHMTMVAKQEEENIIRSKMNQRKKSFVSAYPPIVVKPKEENDDTDNYAMAGCYKKYTDTIQGKKALSEMPDWVFRPKSAKQKKSLDPEIVDELNNTLNNMTNQQRQQSEDNNNERYDTVDINLNPNQSLQQPREIYIKPSVFTQRQIDEERAAFEEEKKAYFYHEKKRKDFNVTGGERVNKPEVKSLMRTQPISEINQKYLITEAPLDRKVKIASMRNKLTSGASSLVEMRKQGPHNTLLRTLDKRNDYSQLLEKRTMMVHADLNDKLQRDILITPVEANFGNLKQGRMYELRLNVKNEDILAQRINLKKPRNIIAKVQMNELGPIALGMSRKVIVQLKASSEFMGKYTDEFEIVSKHEVYKIPITANILSESQFEGENYGLNVGVKEIQEPLRRKASGLPPIN